MSVAAPTPLIELRRISMVPLWLFLVLLGTMLLTILALTYLLWLTLQEFRRTTQEFRKMGTDRKTVELAQTKLLSKAVTLLSTKEPLAFQAVEAMESSISASDIIEPTEEPIDVLMNRFYSDPNSLTEADYERINSVSIGGADPDGLVR